MTTIPPRIPPPLDNTERKDRDGVLIEHAKVVACYRCGISVVPGMGVQVPIGKLLPIVHAACPILLMIFLSGCLGWGERMPAIPDPDASHGPIATALMRIAIAAAVAGAAGVFVAILIGVFVQNIPLACKVGTAAVALIIGAAILHWLGSHLALAVGICVVLGVVAGLVWSWINRRWVVDQAEEVTGKDLDRDGDIGGNRDHG